MDSREKTNVTYIYLANILRKDLHRMLRQYLLLFLCLIKQNAEESKPWQHDIIRVNTRIQSTVFESQLSAKFEEGSVVNHKNTFSASHRIIALETARRTSQQFAMFLE